MIEKMNGMKGEYEMARLKKVSTREVKAMVQKTVRLPEDLYSRFEKVMRDAGIDKFNYAIEKLVEMEVEDWEREKKRLKRLEKKRGSNKDGKNDVKKES